MSDGRCEKSWHGVPCRYPDEHGHPLTAEERAKNCLPGCYDPQGRQCSANETCEIHYRVAQEIKAACEELVDRHGDIAVDILIKAKEEGYEKGFADAIERAAKQVEAFRFDRMSLSTTSIIKLIAESVRALTPAGQEKCDCRGRTCCLGICKCSCHNGPQKAWV